MNKLTKYLYSFAIGILLVSSQIPHIHEHEEAKSNPIHQCQVCEVQNHFSASAPDNEYSHAFNPKFQRLAILDAPLQYQSNINRKFSTRAPPTAS